MPFVWDVEPLQERESKRRKISAGMARYSMSYGQEEDDVQFPFEQVEDLPTCNNVQEDGATQDIAEKTVRTSDRQELIQCIKRGQRTTWVPKPGLEAACAEVNYAKEVQPAEDWVAPGQPLLANPGSYVSSQRQSAQSTSADVSATDILRRSLSTLNTAEAASEHEGSSEATTPSRQISRDYLSSSQPLQQQISPLFPSLPRQRSSPLEMLGRARAPSLGSSLSSSFVMRVPTSPLVQATNNPALDFSPREQRVVGTGRSARRRTLPPNAFDSAQMKSLQNAVPNFSRPLQSQPRDGDPFSPGHRLNRSLSSFTYQPAPSPQAPGWLRQRRLSMASDTSPRHRASMVGSFEESILRGRMSTPPSKPFDFVAQIGVMGKGDCPASLKCPAHVTVPFSAVFYSYSSGTAFRSISDDNPSPYVGSVDLENNLKVPDEPRRRQSRHSQEHSQAEGSLDDDSIRTTSAAERLAHRRSSGKSSTISKVPLGGAYRVPQQGQLQVIIKNPNKTAVKLFLVPYDLTEMVPGTKTFVRQRSYSSGPLLETSNPEKQAIMAARDPLSSKDILRYLIHLKFCCTAKGRFYLYDNIRAVFANRVPEGKEKLRNEVQVPEPKYSEYKPALKKHSRSTSGMSEGQTSPLGPPLTPDSGLVDGLLDGDVPERRLDGAQQYPNFSFQFPRRADSDCDAPKATWNGPIVEKESAEDDLTLSPTPGFLPSISARGSPVPWGTPDRSPTPRTFSPTPGEFGLSLLSQSLRKYHESAGRDSG